MSPLSAAPLLCLCLVFGSAARAVTLNASDASGSSSFNAKGNWSDALAPGAGKAYLTGNKILRSPAAGATYVFGGDSLSIDTGGRLLGKVTGGVQTLTVGNLTLNGGTLDEAGTNADTGKLIVGGAINVAAPSFLGALGAAANNSASFETLELTATLSGSSAITVAGSANAGADTGVVVLSAANPYAGTITVNTPGSGFVASATHRLLQLNHREALRYATLNLDSTVNGISFAAAANTGPFLLGGLSGNSAQTLADSAGAAVTVEVGGNGADTTFSGAFSGPGRLIKTGAGTLTLAGATTLATDLAVRSGKLALAGGSLTVASITLSAGATLDVSAPSAPALTGLRLFGEGDIHGSLTFGAGAELHPGCDAAAGSLSFHHSLTLATGATVHVDLAASPASVLDSLPVVGTLSLDQTTFHLRARDGAATLDPSVSYVLATAASVTGLPNASPVWVGTPPANAADVRVLAPATPVRLQVGGTPLYAVGGALPAAVAPGRPVLLTVYVTPGTAPASTDLVVLANLAPLGGSSAQLLYDDGTHGDRVPGDGRFSFLVTVGSNVATGSLGLNAVATDGEERSATATLALSIVPVISSRYIAAPFPEVSEIESPGSFPVAVDGGAASIHYDTEDAAVVGIAARALRDDIGRVSGVTPTLSTAAPAAGSTPIIIGTLGRSSLVGALVGAGKIDVSDIQGQWEAYLATVVANPLPGVAKALVIVGADRRGTAFGAFALSEAMGVSPWYFWGDVPVTRRSAVHVASGAHIQPSPSVRYRGVFFNDEDWGLQPWAAKTFEPEVGNIGPKTYATIFELLLRLHANVFWPAMHEFPVVTTPFYLVPGNKEMADDYAIVVSTSHHEPMLRNSHEYDESVLGSYNYWTNRTNIYNFWEQRVIETAGYENIYTMGMRGRTDAGMLAPDGTTAAQKAAKIQNEIIPDQRQMIADHVNPVPAQVPQIFIPYKETLVQYQAGLQLPDDVTILWPDDNHGYIRQLSNPAERARSGGSGVYYHLSYWGVPRSYLWFCTTPPGMTRSEMLKAWDFEARRMWIVNVGDLKPHEIGAEFFLRMARNPEAFRDFEQRTYLTEWAARNFGPVHAATIAAILEEYYRLNIIVRPEHLDRASSGFDFVGAGGQDDAAQARLDQFAALVATADALYAQLSADMKPAFYEMVLFPLRTSHLVNKKVLLAERSRLWAVQGRAATAALAAEAQAASTAHQGELGFYNLVNAGGKWNYMMNPMAASALPAWAQETQSPFYMPTLGSYAAPAAAGLGVVVEGSATPLAAGTSGQLPVFSRAAARSAFVDVFNTGSTAFSWTAAPSDSWILLSQSGGTTDARLRVSIDWTRAPRGYAIPGSVTLQGAGSTRVVQLKVFNPLGLDVAALPAAVENNGLVVIEAENYFARQDGAGGVGWRRVPRATVNGDGMTIQPVTAAGIAPAELGANTPSLTYEFQAFSHGSALVTVKCLPTHRITSDHPGLRYAVSLNGDTPKVIDLHANEYTAAWNANVLRAYSAGVSYHTVAAAGRQTIKIQMIDPGVVLDQITVQISPGVFEAEQLSYAALGAYHAFTESGASGGGAISLDSTAVGQSITFALPDLAPGTYDLAVRAKKGPSRGIAQLSIADSDSGPFVAVGGPVDLYASALAYVDLTPVRLSLATGGAKYLKFEVVGKNASASDYWIVLDRFAFSTPALAASPLQAWRETYFGTLDNVQDAADAADPDGDGIPNLLEYATGSSPTDNNPPNWSHATADRHLALTFPWLKAASDITYRVLAGDRLDEMSDIWTGVSIAYPGGSAASVMTTVTDPLSFDSSASRFLRLEISTD